MIKGDHTSANLVVRNPGGHLDGMTTVVTGESSLENGEEVVVFLKRDSKGNFALKWGASGKFEVFLDAENYKYVHYSEDYLNRGPETMSLDAFIRLIRENL